MRNLQLPGDRSLNANPFRSPVTDREALAHSPMDLRPQEVGKAFLHFEKLRIAYNGLLLAAVVFQLLVWQDWLDSLVETGTKLVMGCVMANVCYSTGTMICAYLAYLGIRHKVVHYGIFLLGTAVSIPLVALTLRS